jgi:hypothetical protein
MNASDFPKLRGWFKNIHEPYILRLHYMSGRQPELPIYVRSMRYVMSPVNSV